MYHIVRKGRHLPGTVGSQKEAAGMQLMALRNTEVIDQQIMKTRPTAQALCIADATKMRRYWSKMEILTTERARL
jgi:hypothetical protein